MPVLIQLRHDLAANWTSANPTLAVGELGVEYDTNQMKLGNGTTAWTGLPYYSIGPVGATGPAGPHGKVTINFGSLPGNNETSIFVSDTNVLSTSKAFAEFEYDSTVDHTPSDHMYAAMLCSVICSDCTAGVGFTIYITCMEKLSGTFKIIYSWS